MRWFKHMTASADDEKLSRLKDDYGLEGYGFWWSVVEIVAAKLDENANTSAEYSPKKWGNLLGISPKKFQKLAEYCSNLELFLIEVSQNSITINMPNLLKYRDEYTERQHKKSGQSRHKLPPSRARGTDTETDTDTEADKNNISKHTGISEELEPAREHSDGPHDFSRNIDPTGIEFQELRLFYDEYARSEAPLTGLQEYKQLRAARDWPGMGSICDAIMRHQGNDPDGWGRFAPGLARFLRERWWKKEPTPPRSRLPDRGRNGDDGSRALAAAKLIFGGDEKNAGTSSNPGSS